MKKIQMVDLHSQYNLIKGKVDSAINEVITTTSFINGPAVKDFAKELAEYNDVEHVIPCANGTDALQLAMMALDLQPGDEVIVPAFTYVATAEVIALLRLKPIFVDVEPDTFNIDISGLEHAITEKTKAIVVVHLFGQCCNMDNILEISNKHRLYVIEDTAQAIGAKYTFEDGSVMRAGTMGTIGTTSFFPSKNLGCYGDGGALFTRDSNLAEKIRMVANHGQRVKYYHDIIGVNSRLDTLQAAILRVKLKELDRYELNRNRVAAYYDEKLGSIENITLPKRFERSTHVFHQYTLKIEEGDRNELKDYLANKGIPSMVYYPLPLHLQKAYIHYEFSKGDFPVSEQLCEIVLSLPVHTEFEEEQLDYITQTIIDYF
ncbi:DegT/DnrJ/EryC1/StrS family aminotransferase [Fulvivirgaceae bacterium BMA10]|uniref:DegT/DnrJ/EryC1/StrS family aminotransferase n=1 Tax=Splendidivirga corallicola TaxID=3051826 RepID=A0ABT8KLQ0_9BACT|nr:DegT/DnrJ/EryC1/StrS family aminotransferase [Fulvivirgaceae bacterium BMA10]